MSGWSGGEGIGDVSERFASAWANSERASAWFRLDLTAQKMLHVAFRGSRPLKTSKKKRRKKLHSEQLYRRQSRVERFHPDASSDPKPAVWTENLRSDGGGGTKATLW